LKTYNDRRGILSTFLKFAFQRSWIVDNPIFKVPHHRIRRRSGSAATLTAAQARDLMEHLESFEGGRWAPYLGLCLFAGVRPGMPDGEISKLRPEAVDFNANTIFVPAEVSKTREPRRVVIQPNLAAWLRAYPLERFPIVVADFQKRRAKFAKTFHLTHDVLRQAFISMFAAKYRSMGEAALQAGNSESIIRKHYLDLKNASEAEEFFNIMPKQAHANVLAAGAEFPNLKRDVSVVALPRHPRRHELMDCLGYGNTLNTSQWKPAYGHQRTAPRRDFPQGQGTVYLHPNTMDKATPHSPSPHRTLRLL